MTESAEIILLHEGSEYSVEIEDLSKTIDDVLSALVASLGLPRYDDYGVPYVYYLGRVKDDQSEILHPYINNNAKTLADYFIQSGDTLSITYVPNAAGKWLTNQMKF